MGSTPVTRALAALNIPHRLFRHPGPVHSLEQAASERGQRPEQVVRSIVFRLAKDDFVMVLIAGSLQVSWPALRSYLGQSRLTMASEAEVLSVTGYPVGAVSPFGLPAPMRILVDQSVLSEDVISIGSGERYATVILRTEDLLKTLRHGEVGEFAQKEKTELPGSKEPLKMAATLDNLVQIEGVIIAFEFKADGTCTDYRSHQKTGPEMAALMSRYCALVTMTLATLASSFTALSEQNWIPQQGWTYTGGDYTVVIGGSGYRGVFAEKNRVNLNALVEALAG